MPSQPSKVQTPPAAPGSIRSGKSHKTSRSKKSNQQPPPAQDQKVAESRASVINSQQPENDYSVPVRLPPKSKESQYISPSPSVGVPSRLERPRDPNCTKASEAPTPPDFNPNKESLNTFLPPPRLFSYHVPQSPAWHPRIIHSSTSETCERRWNGNPLWMCPGGWPEREDRESEGYGSVEEETGSEGQVSVRSAQAGSGGAAPEKMESEGGRVGKDGREGADVGGEESNQGKHNEDADSDSDSGESSEEEKEEEEEEGTKEEGYVDNSETSSDDGVRGYEYIPRHYKEVDPNDPRVKRISPLLKWTMKNYLKKFPQQPAGHPPPPDYQEKVAQWHSGRIRIQPVQETGAISTKLFNSGYFSKPKSSRGFSHPREPEPSSKLGFKSSGEPGSSKEFKSTRKLTATKPAWFPRD
ncbi:hypothetical protein ABW19_dt0208157 [Dactylella cylindrospora]|nr:hypothetical protein ABW19_dt0208157 [Dactylella cylindrospora]